MFLIAKIHPFEQSLAKCQKECKHIQIDPNNGFHVDSPSEPEQEAKG